MLNNKQSTTEDELPTELMIIEKAGKITLEWAAKNKINYLRIELVAPSIHIDKRFSVWLFFDTESQMKEYEEVGTTQKIKDKYLASLRSLNYPDEYFPGIVFFTDSDENVKRFTSIKPVKIG